MKQKVVISLIFLFFLTNSILSQPSEGDLSVGGLFSYFKSSSKEENISQLETLSTNFSIMPVFNFFLTDNIAIGGGIGYNYDFVETEEDYNIWPTPPGITKVVVEETRKFFSFNPFVRYYPGQDAAGVFIETGAGLGLGDSREKYELGNNIIRDREFNIFKWNIAVSPGFYYFANENFSFEAKMGFLGFSRYIEEEEDDQYSETDYGIILNPANVSFGIYYHF